MLQPIQSPDASFYEVPIGTSREIAVEYATRIVALYGVWLRPRAIEILADIISRLEQSGWASKNKFEANLGEFRWWLDEDEVEAIRYVVPLSTGWR